MNYFIKYYICYVSLVYYFIYFFYKDLGIIVDYLWFLWLVQWIFSLLNFLCSLDGFSSYIICGQEVEGEIRFRKGNKYLFFQVLLQIFDFNVGFYGGKIESDNYVNLNVRF